MNPVYQNLKAAFKNGISYFSQQMECIAMSVVKVHHFFVGGKKNCSVAGYLAPQSPAASGVMTVAEDSWHSFSLAP